MTILTILTFLSLAAVGYVYLGYPIVLALLARLRSRPVDRALIFPTISLIIAAYNEAGVIGRKVANSLTLDYPQDKLQIIVVADGSSDETAAVVQPYQAQGVLLLHNRERRGKSAALNRGAAVATGEILVFSDANAFYLPDALQKLVRNFHDPAVGGVSGRKTIRDSEAAVSQSEGLYWRYESFIKAKESQIGSTTGVVGEMMAVRHQLFQPIPEQIICDDAYLAYSLLRQGHRVVYEPEAISWETSAATTQGEMTRRQNINAGRYQLFFRPRLWPWNNPLALFQLISHKFMRLLLPFFMLSGLLGNLMVVGRRREGRGRNLQNQSPNPPILAPRPAALYLTLVGQLLFYGLALVGWLGERGGRRWKLPALAWYITSSNLASVNGLRRYLAGRQTVLWTKVERGRLPGEITLTP
ncbi:MAG: glycosyltransferase family 2 protein [Chloroflexota bacterium]